MANGGSTPFLIGRDTELRSILDLLARDDVRLVTLIGPGGVGKTTLATRLLESSPFATEGRTRLVQMAPLRDPDLFALTIARALGVREMSGISILERIATELEGAPFLLCLDNLEHLLAAAPVVAALLRECPTLKILATSRAPLNLTLEHRVPLDALGLPAGEQLNDIGGAPSVVLFAERARRVLPGFRLGDDNAADVAAICRELDGLPLAIELAAARLAILSPALLRKRLDSQLRLLTGGPADLPARLRSMADAIRWSYDLLDSTEQAVCRRLAVFLGGWTLERAEALCAATGIEHDAVLPAMTALIENSLLRRLDGPANAEPRFGMLETVREFGLEELAVREEIEAARDVHAALFAALALEAEPELETAQQVGWFNELAAEHDNLRAALDRYLASGDSEEGLRMCVALCRFWDTRDFLTEGRTYTERFLALSRVVPAAVRARALETLAEMSLWLAEPGPAMAAAGEARDTWRSLADNNGLIRTDVLLSQALLQAGRFEEALGHARESVEIAGKGATSRWQALARYNVALGKWLQGDAGDLAQEIVAIRVQQEQAGDRSELATTIATQAQVAFDAGDMGAAEALWREQLAVALEVGELGMAVEYIEGTARILLKRGDHERAAVALGAAWEWRTRHNAPLFPNISRVDYAYSEARRSLGDERTTTLMASGAKLSLEEAFALVAGPPAARTGSDALGSHHDLTPREAEIAALLARRLTDREIAETLVISPRTVTTHVAAILGKLGVTSRREVTGALGGVFSSDADGNT